MKNVAELYTTNPSLSLPGAKYFMNSLASRFMISHAVVPVPATASVHGGGAVEHQHDERIPAGRLCRHPHGGSARSEDAQEIERRIDGGGPGDAAIVGDRRAIDRRWWEGEVRSAPVPGGEVRREELRRRGAGIRRLSGRIRPLAKCSGGSEHAGVQGGQQFHLEDIQYGQVDGQSNHRQYDHQCERGRDDRHSLSALSVSMGHSHHRVRLRTTLEHGTRSHAGIGHDAGNG